MRLAPQLAVQHRFGSSLERRSRARRQVTRTLWRTALVAILLGGPGLFWVAHADPPHMQREVAAVMILRAYAFEAFPQWAITHHADACPTSIDELSPFIARVPLDPWGMPLALRCGAGYWGADVRSAGPDRTFDTADDLTSNAAIPR